MPSMYIICHTEGAQKRNMGTQKHCRSASLFWLCMAWNKSTLVNCSESFWRPHCSP